MFKLVLEKSEEPEVKLPNPLVIKKAREFQKNIYFCFIDYAKAFDCVAHNKLWKILKEISSLSHSVVFLYFFALIAEEGFFSLLAFLWNSAFRCLYLSFSPLLFTSLLFIAICQASSDSHFAFLHFFSTGMVLIPVSCTMSQTSFHSSSGTLSDLGP